LKDVVSELTLEEMTMAHKAVPPHRPPRGHSETFQHHPLLGWRSVI
jgi:hypothetical protein